jgi:hypothetical protein
MNIDKNIAVPNVYGRWQRAAKEMEPGDSTTVKTRNQVLAARHAFSRAGKGIVSRKIESGFRIWCVKEK